MILWPESFLGLVEPPQQEETPISMTQHGRRLLTSTVMADKVGSPHARTNGHSPGTAFQKSPYTLTNPHHNTRRCEWPCKMVALSNNLTRKVQGKVTQHIRTDLGVRVGNKKAVQYLCFLGTECSTSIRFPLSSTLPAKIKNKITVFEHSSYMLLLRMLRRGSWGLRKIR